VRLLSTIYQAFEKLRDAGTLAHAAAPRNFEVALVLLGILMLIVGIIYDVLRRARLRVCGWSEGEGGGGGGSRNRK
jgi:hypothetical protein